MIFTVMFLIFVLLSLFYGWFLFRIYSGLRNLSDKDDTPGNQSFSSVSIIIPFRNESDNILNSLRHIVSQEYPLDKYEVIYVNDSSTDDSLQKIMCADKPANIKVISVPADFHTKAHKKRAIRYALQFAQGEIIASTDCDCFMGPDWLKTMTGYFNSNTAFVSGPVDFYDTSTISGRLQRLEFAGLVLSGAGLIGAGTPTICNAANLAYRKSVFDEVGGFDDNIKLSSGDDEILMQKIAAVTSYDIKFCCSRKSLVSTYPNRTFGQFYQQRKRWASKGLFYVDKILIAKLFFIFLFYLSLPVQLLLIILGQFLFLYSIIAAIAVKVFIEYRIMKYGERRIYGSGLTGCFLLAEMLHVPYIIIAAISGAAGNFKWKDRDLKR